MTNEQNSRPAKELLLNMDVVHINIFPKETELVLEVTMRHMDTFTCCSIPRGAVRSDSFHTSHS